MRFILTFICVLIFSVHSFSQSSILKQNIEDIIEGKQATVGVGLIINGQDTLIINGESHYPTLSVYKFHLALAVLDYLEKNNIPLEHELLITKEDLLPDTYSPLRDTYPEGNIYMSIAELIKYSVSKSDNNACDILFRFIGGTDIVDQYIRALGIKDISIAATEEEMHINFEHQYLNWTTLLSAVELLEIFKQGNKLLPALHDFLLKAMLGSETGGNKIKALLPSDVKVAHKTGNSSRNDEGLKAADNDAAIIYLPDGRYYSLAILVKDSKETDDTNAKMIADISKVVYNYISLNE